MSLLKRVPCLLFFCIKDDATLPRGAYFLFRNPHSNTRHVSNGLRFMTECYTFQDQKENITIGALIQQTCRPSD